MSRGGGKPIFCGLIKTEFQPREQFQSGRFGMSRALCVTPVIFDISEQRRQLSPQGSVGPPIPEHPLQWTVEVGPGRWPEPGQRDPALS